MSVLPVGIGASGGYEISNSLRFRASASAYLSRTFGTPTDAKKFTFSCWCKRGGSDAYMNLLAAYTDANNAAQFFFRNTNVLQAYIINGGVDYSLETTQVFRDPSAHMHIMYVYDSAQATAANRHYFYINGALVTATATTYGALPQNEVSKFNANAVAHYISNRGNSSEYLDGLLSDVYFVDGQALTPSSFGEQNADGVWVPKAYTGTYGNNGFKLNFADAAVTSGSNAGLGKDTSGNGNYWNTTNISVTVGADYDSSIDTPTNNFATLNSIQKGPYATISRANTRITCTATDASQSYSTIGVTTGKWYFEVINKSTGSGASPFSYASVDEVQLTASKLIAASFAAYRSNGSTYGTVGDLGTTTWYTIDDVVGVAIDCDNGAIYFSKNNTWINSGSPTSGASRTGAITTYTGGSKTLVGGCGSYSNSVGDAIVDVNYGQAPNTPTASWQSAAGGYFKYAPPTGFKALCTANLPTVAITNPKKHFDVTTYTGDGTDNRTVTSSLGFTPDFLWLKARSTTTSNAIFDTLRGANFLVTNSTQAESTNASLGWNNTGAITNGFKVDQGSNGSINANTVTFISWLWKANGAGSSNTSGSITSTVSANTTAGFSIVTYTGNGSAGATVGHGLGAVPKFIIIKHRTNPSVAYSWAVYHVSVGNAESLRLDTTDLANGGNQWNSTTPTSSVFTLSSQANANENGVGNVAYCFAEIAGFSKFGSYVGNASTDGPFVYCGFRPRYVLIKSSTASTDWEIWDTARSTYNVANARLFPNATSAENATSYLDVTSNGFKIRQGSGYGSNNSAATYIFAAFAEHPFGGSNVSPSPAR